LINGFKGLLSAEFDDIPELNIKGCVKFITVPLDRILHLFFPFGYFPDILKINIIQSRFKKRAVFYAVCYLLCSKYSKPLTFLNC
jgi:hypothetical protein